MCILSPQEPPGVTLTVLPRSQLSHPGQDCEAELRAVSGDSHWRLARLCSIHHLPAPHSRGLGAVLDSHHQLCLCLCCLPGWPEAEVGLLCEAPGHHLRPR